MERDRVDETQGVLKLDGQLPRHLVLFRKVRNLVLHEKCYFASKS